MANFPAFTVLPVTSVPAKHLLPLTEDRLCRVYWRITDVSGQPIPDVVVAFAPTYTLPTVFGAGQGGRIVEEETDRFGEGEANLVRGMEVEVSIHGASYTRRITVPSDAETDLFALLPDAPDAYSLQNADVITAPRRSI